MKIILSRKGFDSSNGGIPSPILPDGTLLSMPIPEEEGVRYSDISWNGMTYADILKQLAPNRSYDCCHLDPDLRDNRIKHIEGWKPAFGQTGAAQGQLRNAGVGLGDIFLFFGWFRGTEETEEGLKFGRRDSEHFYEGNDLQVIYGYLQVGEIVTDAERIKEYSWHPHASKSHLVSKNNALYLPADRLSIEPSLKGYGVLDYRKDRVLTMEGKSRALWDEYPFLMPDHVRGRKNSAKGEGLYYAGIWQELIVDESDELIEWVKKIVV